MGLKNANDLTFQTKPQSPRADEAATLPSNAKMALAPRGARATVDRRVPCVRGAGGATRVPAGRSPARGTGLRPGGTDG